MATTVSNLKAKLTLDNKDFKKGLKNSEKQTKSFGKQMAKMGGAIAAAFSIGAIVSFTKASVKAYDVQAKAEAKLLTALDGRVDVQQRLMRQASALQRITLFGDEATIEAQAMLATLGLNEDAIVKLIPLVQDLATKSNMGLVQAADMVAKSVGSSTNALSRYGVQIEGAVGSSERLESAVMSLNEQVGGQSEAAAKAGIGAITQLSNAWGDFMEEIGKSMADPAFLALIRLMTETLQGAEEEIKTTKFDERGILTKWFLGKDKDSLKKELDLALKEKDQFYQRWQQFENDPEQRGFWAGELDKTIENIDLLKAALKELEKVKIEVLETPTPTRDQSTIGSISPKPFAGSLSGGEDTTLLPQLKEDADEATASMMELAAAADGVGNSVMGMAGAIDGMINGDNFLLSFGDFLSNLAKLMVDFALLLGMMGTGEALLESGNPYAMIAGAIMIAATVAKIAGSIANIKSSGAGGGAGSASSGGGGYSGGNYDYNREMVFVIRGDDLVASYNNNSNKNAYNGF